MTRETVSIQPMRFDALGNPVIVPKRFKGTYDEFADCVASLESHHCSFPNGSSIDAKTGCPCRRSKVVHDRCTVHAKSMTRSSLRYAKYLPKALGARMAEAHLDEEILNIGHDVELLSTRLTQLMERTGTGESTSLWKDLQTVWKEFEEANREQSAALRSKDEHAIKKWREVALRCISSVGELIKTANKSETAWGEIVGLSTIIAGMKSTETRRRKDAGLTLSVEQAIALVQNLQMIIVDEVSDKATRANISARLATVVGMEHLYREHWNEVVEASKRNEPAIGLGLDSFDGLDSVASVADTVVSPVLSVDAIIHQYVDSTDDLTEPSTNDREQQKRGKQ